jgi:hypothetical protein
MYLNYTVGRPRQYATLLKKLPFFSLSFVRYPMTSNLNAKGRSKFYVKMFISAQFIMTIQQYNSCVTS